MGHTSRNDHQAFDLWIGGERVAPASGKYFIDRNPEDDSPYARVAEGNIADVDRAVQTAHQAFASYGKTMAADREAWLCRAATLMEKYRDEFVDILIDEVGSPFGKAQFEVQYAINCLRAAAGVARRITGQTIPSETPGRFSMTVREPLGVVASISPFNVPLLKNVKLSATPLATGNTVVLLTSEEAPMVANRLAEVYHEAGIPAGAFNVVTGFGDKIGDALTSHPLVKVVMFTGSSRVGRHIASLCGPLMRRVVLELGGKNPLVVLADADLEAAVEAAAFSQFFFQGQACMASSRIYVEKSIEAEFCRRFKAKAESMGMGDLRNPGTWVGPIISERQRQRVKTHIQDAQAKGATVLTGGTWIGNRCRPTILTGVAEGMTVCRDETFGPVTSIYPVADLEEAIACANDTRYGLSAAIFTRDITKAMQFSQRVHAGMVHINAPTIADEPHVPFGGVGESGFGREGTDIDIDTFTEWKWITIQLPA
ncbi:aldehyde dehydrogenase family protein [Denitratisoma oestradiolicum]|uniref:Salicylaldehyde dehydrogenase n=1 Tax=Denitratisoma oestradiolicum TaxID=311182 RepID=A0A6S6Y7I4_9PROT|nr:aldehyde dehydrogenase family protein [Denitratisoma oestradiolicum]TWO79505.1 aldehyde dehydrogenase [Denitratisoma oestradiolicum]CAB1368398.1 Aldehyde dehydrogenase [Denitratisoma oestradiolicum]